MIQTLPACPEDYMPLNRESKGELDTLKCKVRTCRPVLGCNFVCYAAHKSVMEPCTYACYLESSRLKRQQWPFSRTFNGFFCDKMEQLKSVPAEQSSCKCAHRVLQHHNFSWAARMHERLGDSDVANMHGRLHAIE